MAGMFACQKAFNRDISRWDVSKVADMRKRLREISKPVRGTKAELWARLVKGEKEHAAHQAERGARAQRFEDRAAGLVPAEVVQVRGPKVRQMLSANSTT